MIVIVDYGIGNLASVLNMFKKIGATNVCISKDYALIEKATKLILPGVGAFDAGMDNLEKSGLIPLLNKKVIEDKIPLLGIHNIRNSVAAAALTVTLGLTVSSIKKGLKNFKDLRRISFSVFLQVFMIEFVFAIGLIVLKDLLPQIYIDDAAVISTAASLLLIAGIFQLSDGFQVVTP